MEFANNEAWTFLNVLLVYWHIFWRWPHLWRVAGMDGLDQLVDEMVFLEETGQRVSFVQAYLHCGEIFQSVSLYEYMSIVKLKQRATELLRQERYSLIAFGCFWKCGYSCCGSWSSMPLSV